MKEVSGAVIFTGLEVRQVPAPGTGEGLAAPAAPGPILPLQIAAPRQELHFNRTSVPLRVRYNLLIESYFICHVVYVL